MAKNVVVSNQGPRGFCDDNPNVPHRIIITHTADGEFVPEKSCKNWRLHNSNTLVM